MRVFHPAERGLTFGLVTGRLLFYFATPMRLWTLHPQYLDPQGLVAAWREGLLAQKVLLGDTKGYRNHPQLVRFQEQKDPLAAIATYLAGLAEEAARRSYRFDATKIAASRQKRLIRETNGQLLFEWGHLQRKLRLRSPICAEQWRAVNLPVPHPLFQIVPGPVKDWEKGSA